jgi:hypothetical protein
VLRSVAALGRRARPLRSDEIRREVRGFSRWEATDADHPRRIWDILVGDGMRCSRPRP